MPNFTENSRKEFEKFTDISRAPLPLFQVAVLMQTKKSVVLHISKINYLFRINKTRLCDVTNNAQLSVAQ